MTGAGDDKMSSSEVEKKKLLTELKQFRGKLATYKEVVIADRLEEGYRDSAGVLRGQPMSPVQAFRYLSPQLQQEYGILKPVLDKYGGPAEVPLSGGNYSYNAFMSAFTPTLFDDNAFCAILDTAIAAVNMAIGRIDKATNFLPLELLEDSLSSLAEKAIPPKVLIAHGGKTSARDKLEQYLKELGITPLIVEDQPTEGKAVDVKVEHYIERADCAIILATADDKVGEKLQPRQNVIHEIGLAQAKFPKKIIYLLEEKAEFPSNINPKVWESFTQECMDKAFIAIARELTAFGLLKTVKPAS